MLARAVPRSLNARSSSASSHACTCICGRKVSPTGPGSGRRGYAKKSPAVRAQRHRKRPRVLSALERHEQRSLQKERGVDDCILLALQQRFPGGHFTTPVETAHQFLAGFAQLCRDSRQSPLGQPPVSLDRFQTLVLEYDMPERDCIWFARILLVQQDEASKTIGKKLLLTLSHAESERATMRIMQHTLIEVRHERHKAAKLSGTEIAHMRRHLTAIAEKGENYRATVLEGMVENTLDNEVEAIRLWRKAMSAAVASAEVEKMSVSEGRRTSAVDETFDLEEGELDTPWIELTEMHMKRHEYTKAKYAIGIGCTMGDPLSHYTAARFERKENAEKEHVPTSAWLYHMTKAAASMHPEAQHELGIFYARSGWKYIEDEPADHLKPTAFDSCPPEAGSGKKDVSLGDRLRIVLGLAPRVEDDPREHVFTTAVYPSTAELRMRMALEWLHLAKNLTYAPSALFLARLHLEKTLWSEMAAPRSALKQRDDRYDYASKADFQANRPIDRPPDDEADKQEYEIPNPYYNPDLAYENLREVFFAVTAQKWGININEAISRKRSSGQLPISDLDKEEMFSSGEGRLNLLQDQLGRRMPDWATPFYKYSHIREMYMEDDNERCWDKVMKENLETAAKELCEEQGWDVYAPDGKLLFKHGMRQGSAQG